AARGTAGTAIPPGYPPPPMAESYFASQPDPAAGRAAQEAAQPLKRLGRPEEIAAVAAMLASDEARFMTGSNLVIDGAITIRMYD
ncbi:SDR family oxidoreductase, partial [Nostoc sp. NIES-2111]